MSKKRRLDTKELLKNLSVDELHYAIGRYCGPHNELLSYKKYGIVLDQKEVENEIFERTFLGDNSDNSSSDL